MTYSEAAHKCQSWSHQAIPALLLPPDSGGVCAPSRKGTAPPGGTETDSSWAGCGTGGKLPHLPGAQILPLKMRVTSTSCLSSL